jgi:hypothetical protein
MRRNVPTGTAMRTSTCIGSASRQAAAGGDHAEVEIGQGTVTSIPLLITDKRDENVRFGSVRLRSLPTSKWRAVLSTNFTLTCIA